jgi:DNA invertase Pin-like site-specific DNA recombinase
MFQIIGAMAEFGRSLIQERVRAGLRNVKAKGRRLGRPQIAVDASRIAALGALGHSWCTICRETGIGKGTAQRGRAATKARVSSAMREKFEKRASILTVSSTEVLL